MLVNITEHFIEAGREWQVGQNPDVPREVADRWISEGKATTDTDGARDQSPVSGGTRKNVGTRLIAGRSNAVAVSSTLFTGTALAVGLTQHQRHVLPVQFDAVRIAIPNMHTAAVNGVKAAFGVSNTLGALTTTPTLNNSTGVSAAAPTPTEVVSSSLNTFRQATFGGQLTATLPAAIDAANIYPSWTWSDWTQVASVDRTDGDAGSILDLRIFIPVAGSLITSAYTGGANDAWGIWARTDVLTGGRVMRVWNQDVDGIATPASFTSTTTRANHIPVIVQYMARGEVQTFLAIGDSIVEASAGVAYTGNSPAWRAALAASTPTEVCHLTMPGGTSIQYTNRIQQLLREIPATHMLAPAASVNNFGTTLGSRVSGEAGGTVGVLANAARITGADLAMYGFLPVSNAAKAYGATDSYRVTANAMAEARAAQIGATWIDLVGYFSGTAHASGQIEPQAALTPDGVHMNDAGCAGAADLIAPFLA